MPLTGDLPDSPLWFGSAEEFWARSNQDIIASFIAMKTHDRGGGARSAANYISPALKPREAFEKTELPLLLVVTDVALWGAIMQDDRSLYRGGQTLRVTTIQGRRSAFKAFASVVPPPPGYSRADFLRQYEAAREFGETTVGQKRRLTSGDRNEPDLYVPTPQEIDSIAAWSAGRPLKGPFHAKFLTFLHRSGVRIGAALALRARDFETRPDGSTWFYVYEKSRRDRRPVLLRPDLREVLPERTGLEANDLLWTWNSQPVADYVVRHWVRTACNALSIRQFRPHALRAAFARDFLTSLGYDATRRLGGWASEAVFERYLDHGQGKD